LSSVSGIERVLYLTRLCFLSPIIREHHLFLINQGVLALMPKVQALNPVKPRAIRKKTPSAGGKTLEIKNANQKESIYEILLHRIINTDYKPGQLLNERELCKEFNTSRTPIREVMIQLSHAGYVEIKPKVGTYVSPVNATALKYIFEVKVPLEGIVAELAAYRITSEELEQLERVFQRIETCPKEGFAVSSYDYHELDQEFHKICREATRNAFLIKYLDELMLKTMRFLHYIHYDPKELEWYTDTLRDLLEGIKNRDGERAKTAAILHNTTFIKKLSEFFFGQGLA
jgi:DNA-binding GntR family transcriptional regulator